PEGSSSSALDLRRVGTPPVRPEPKIKLSKVFISFLLYHRKNRSVFLAHIKPLKHQAWLLQFVLFRFQNEIKYGGAAGSNHDDLLRAKQALSAAMELMKLNGRKNRSSNLHYGPKPVCSQ
ncbi:hypothetical protein P5G51_000005, partial [Virgibacillus sp. 179-BFC.A HS]